MARPLAAILFLCLAGCGPSGKNPTNLIRVSGKAVAPDEVSVSAPPDPVPAAVDRDQLLALLTNLLFNALEATPTGGTVGVSVNGAPGGALTVEVTDTGAGIDPAVAPRLFTPFATTKPTGTGLGLSVARRIARDHGGTLTAANRPDRGATFTLTLPSGG